MPSEEPPPLHSCWLEEDEESGLLPPPEYPFDSRQELYDVIRQELPPPIPVPVGQIANIFGLRAATHLNGRLALVLEAGEERAQVKLIANAKDHIASAGKVIAIRLQNLKPHHLGLSEIWICALCHADACHPQFHSSVGWGMSGRPGSRKWTCPGCSGTPGPSPITHMRVSKTYAKHDEKNAGSVPICSAIPAAAPLPRVSSPPSAPTAAQPSPCQRAHTVRTRPRDMPTNVADAFECLRLEAGKGRGIAKSELVGAYRQACLKAHPDKGGTSDLFSETQASYQTILEYIEIGIPRPQEGQPEGASSVLTKAKTPSASTQGYSVSGFFAKKRKPDFAEDFADFAEVKAEKPKTRGQPCQNGSHVKPSFSRRWCSLNFLGLGLGKRRADSNEALGGPKSFAAGNVARVPEHIASSTQETILGSKETKTHHGSCASGTSPSPGMFAQQPDLGSTKAPESRTFIFTLKKLSPSEQVGLMVKKSNGRLLITRFVANSAVDRQNSENAGGIVLAVGDIICSVNGHTSLDEINACLTREETIQIEVQRDM